MASKTQATFLAASIALCTCFCTISACNSDQNNNVLQDFRLPGLDGSRFYLGDHRGKIVVMAFWSVHCVPCHRELGDLSKHHLIKDGGVKLISICVDPEDRALVEQGSRISGTKISVFLDHNRKLANSLGIKTEPTTLIIDQKGAEFSRFVGWDKPTLKLLERNVALLKEGSSR